VSVQRGWTGRFFEDFTVGDIYEHQLGRTVTATDNAWFTLLTQNTASVHFDQHYAAQTEFGRALVNSALTIALVTGQSVSDVSQNVFANLGWDEVRLPNPLFEGDTVYSVSECTSITQSTKRRHCRGTYNRIPAGRKRSDRIPPVSDGVSAGLRSGKAEGIARRRVTVKIAKKQRAKQAQAL
jgi:itaconyl-CoA hydratase